MFPLFESIRKSLDHHTHRYSISRHSRPVSFADAVKLWQHDEAFREFFISLLVDSPFPAFRWETPMISQRSVDRDFEFVLIDSPDLIVEPDQLTFQEHFSLEAGKEIVVFENINRDAVLVVPIPILENSDYSHLAAFLRNAPNNQSHALCRVIGETVDSRIGERPIWLSTAGGGVAWLHVRLDCRPKYYRHAAYKKQTSSGGERG
jgi:hypothetical protein